MTTNSNGSPAWATAYEAQLAERERNCAVQRWYVFYAYQPSEAARWLDPIPTSMMRYVKTYGPVLLKGNDASTYELHNISSRGQVAFRLVYLPNRGWVWDTRSSSAFFDCSPPSSSQPYMARLPASVSPYGTPSLRFAGRTPEIGTTAFNPPVTGRWPYVGFPPLVTMLGGDFRLAQWKWPKPGVAAQYRETKPKNSRHLYVMQGGSYVISHADEVNPDMGGPFQHFIQDVVKRPAPISPLEAELRRKAPAI